MKAFRWFALGVIVLTSAQGAHAAAPGLAGEVRRIGTLLDKWPLAMSEAAARGQMKIIARILGMPLAAEVYLDDLFDATTDPVFMPPGESGITPEQRKKLLAVRGRVLYIATMLSKASYWPYINSLLRDVPAADRPAAARFLDRFCSEIRPRLFRRALAVSKLGFSYVDGIDDLRVRDALAAYCKRHERPMHRSSPVRLLRHAAGQRDLMRRAFAETYSRSAFDYLRHMGDNASLTQTLLSRLKTERSAYTRGEIRSWIGKIDRPGARKLFMGFLDEQQANLKAHENVNLWIRFPDFFDQPRAAWYVRLYSDKARTFRMKREGIGQLLRWLGRHRSREGVELARGILAADPGQSGWARGQATDYLLALRDKATVTRIRADLASDEAGVVNRAIWCLVRAGLWDGLPRSLEKLLLEGKYQASHAARILDAAEAYPDRKAHMYVWLASESNVWKLRARVLLVRMGDREVIPLLKKLLPMHWSAARIPAMAALYEAGEADQLDGLLAAMGTEGFAPEIRATAARALGASPKPLRTRAAQALVPQLLSPYGAVSEAAHGALTVLSGRKDIAFSPWATDDVRTRQAQAWRAWLARSIEKHHTK